MVSEKKHAKEAKEECPKCEGEGCDHCDGKGYHEMEEAKKLDPVNDKENDKPFAKRKDKDIDNDGDVDSSDEYLHKKRAATDDAIDGGKKPADNAKDDKKKKDKNPRTSDKTAEISKIESTTKESVELDEAKKRVTLGGTSKQGGVFFMGAKGIDDMIALSKKNPKTEYTVKSDNYGNFKAHWLRNGKFAKQTVANIEYDMDKNAVRGKPKGKDVDNTIFSLMSITNESLDFSEAFEVLWSAIEEAVNQKKGATPPEGMDDKESKSGKDFKAMHKVDVKSHDDMEKVEEPKERKIKKEMNEFEVIRALLSGKPTGE